MPSNSLLRWRGAAQADLDDIVDAHASVAGAARGRRAATAQVTQAYAVLVSSHFQRFCRELHSEAIDHVVLSLAEPWARPIVANRLGEGRKLDTGNPNPGNIGSDFSRLAITLWTRMSECSSGEPEPLAQRHRPSGLRLGEGPGPREWPHRSSAFRRDCLARGLRSPCDDDGRRGGRAPHGTCRSRTVVVP